MKSKFLRVDLQPSPLQKQGTLVGLIVFSPTLKLLYMNRHVKKLLPLSKSQTEDQPEKLPHTLITFGEEVWKTLKSRANACVWQPFEIKRLHTFKAGSVLFRGFGFPNSYDMKRSRIILVLTTPDSHAPLSRNLDTSSLP